MLRRNWTVQLGYGPISGRPPVVGMYLVSEPELKISVSLLLAQWSAIEARAFSGIVTDRS